MNNTRRTFLSTIGLTPLLAFVPLSLQAKSKPVQAPIKPEQKYNEFDWEFTDQTWFIRTERHLGPCVYEGVKFQYILHITKGKRITKRSKCAAKRT